MSDARIYYFSGTGNTLVVAKRIAERLDGTLHPIAAVDRSEPIETDASVIGITFPVYYADLPNIVRRFAEQLVCAEETYIFGVATYGGAVSASFKSLARILAQRGLSLAAGYGVHMPQNAFRKPWENKLAIYRRAQSRIHFVTRSVEARRGGLHYANLALQLLLTPLGGFFQRMTAPALEKAAGLPKASGLTVQQLIPLADRSLSASEACTGCGLCTQVCPVTNIGIVESRPVWHSHCENCLACVNWCPQNAIRGGIVSDTHRYHHPHVSWRDIAAQSRPSN